MKKLVSWDKLKKFLVIGQLKKLKNINKMGRIIAILAWVIVGVILIIVIKQLWTIQKTINVTKV